VCADSSTDTVANPLSPWLPLIVLFGLRLVKPFTFTESHKMAHYPKPESVFWMNLNKPSGSIKDEKFIAAELLSVS
jgi:hypothetical protein